MKKKFYYLIFLVAFATLPAGAQMLNLSYPEKLEIKKRAELKMEEFEVLLNFIADPTRSRGAVDNAILSSYTNGEFFNKVFYNDQVRIEEDITPNISAKGNVSVSDVAVPTYLNDFKLYYDKQREKSVIFDNLVFSDVLQGEFPYIVVSYDSHFKSTHRELKSQVYLPQKRRATLRAEYDKENDRWQLWIIGVNYAQGPPPAAFPAPPSEETRQEPEPAEALPSLQFSGSLPGSIKKGKTLELAWNNPVENAEFVLYKGDKAIGPVKGQLNGKQWDWRVNQKPGKGYSIKLYEPSSQRSIKSSPFRIKRKFPLAIKVAIPIAVVGYVVLAKKNEWPPFKKEIITPPGPGPDPEQPVLPEITTPDIK